MRRINEILASLGDIPSVWHKLGLPGEPEKSCKSPFREDRNPSFSIFEDGHRWKDHATGESGDAIDFYATAKGITTPDAIRELAGNSRAAFAGPFKAPTRPPKKVSEPTRKITLPKCDNGTWGEVIELQRARRLAMNAGIQLLINWGLLRFCTYEGNRGWLLTDSSRRCAQVRRLDGNNIATQGGETKAKTLPGSSASWPVGAAIFGTASNIVLCEGGPDLIAAVTVWFMAGKPGGWAFAAMLGAAQSIHADALELFHGKRVVVASHYDAAGDKAASKWCAQLNGAGASLVLRWRAITPGDDLNDAVSRGGEHFEDAALIFQPHTGRN